MRRTTVMVLLPMLLATACSGRQAQPDRGSGAAHTVAPAMSLPGASTPILSGPPPAAISTSPAARRNATGSIQLPSSTSTTMMTSTPPASSTLATQLPRKLPLVTPTPPTRSAIDPSSSPITSGRPAGRSPELPGGGRTLLPGHLLVALYGQPGVAGLGALGEQDTAASIQRIRSFAAHYVKLSTAAVLPTFEIIATVADSAAGPDGDYSAETSVADLQPVVDAATAAGLYVVLDLQPGRTDFLTQARRYTPLLRRPNVGLALDPEWRLAPGQRHLQQIGSVDASEINTVSAWLAELASHARLPQKLLLIHQFQLAMIGNEASLNTNHPELAMLIQMDGQGSPEAKDRTWQAITAAAPTGIGFGWKNFLTRDSPTLSAADTMGKKPTPELVSYE